MQRTNNGEFNWVDLSAKEFDRQSAFYQELFGWSHQDMPSGEGPAYRIFYRSGDPVGAIAQLPPEMIAAGVPTAWNVYVAADDVDRTVDRAVELGACVQIEPRDVPGAGRTAAIKDPTGAFLFLWTPTESSQTTKAVYMRPGAFSWADLNTRDVDRAIGFYTQLFGWQITCRDDDPLCYRQISVGGTGEGGMLPMPPSVPAETPSFWMPYFGTEDVRADVGRVRELGGSVLADVQEAGDMVAFAVVADPAGAALALMQPIGEMHW